MFRLMISFLFFVSLSSITLAGPQKSPQPNNSPDLDISSIQALTNLKGEYNDTHKLFKITVPRDDLVVMVNGVRLTSAMGLNSWVTFKKIDKFTVMKGELVLTDTQVDPVLGTAISNHVAVTALHNHFLWDSPKVMFMQIEGVGTEKDLAKSLGNVFAKLNATSQGNGEFPVATIDTSVTTLNPTQVNTIVRAKGYGKNGIYKVAVGGAIINGQAIFAGSDNAAVVEGSFVVHDADLQNVLAELHKSKIQVVSIHQQMSNDGRTPVVDVHYWGIGDTKHLAHGVRFAMNAARLYSKDQLLLTAATKAPAPTITPLQRHTAQFVKAVETKLVAVPQPVASNTAQKKMPQQQPVSPSLEQSASNQSAQPSLSPSTIVTPKSASPSTPSQPVSVSSAKTRFNPGLVNNLLSQMEFGKNNDKT